MRKPTPFDFTLKWGERGRTLHVVGSMSPSYPAVMYLPNGDPGYPAEGGEIMDLSISLVHKRKDGVEVEKYLPDEDWKLAEAIEEKIYDHVEADW